MSELNFNPLFQDTTSLLRDAAFSTMYFGRHCGKNILILKHDLTFLLVFRDDCNWSTPEFVKAVCFRGNAGKGIKVVGNENVILLLDKDGNLWRLINAFEDSLENNDCLHSLEEKCFYEWVPFKKFNFAKVLAICAFGCGFACIGVCRNLETKLVVLPSVDSVLEDYTFEGLTTAKSCSYFLTSFCINSINCIYKNILSPTAEVLLVGDRFSGRLYLCSKHGTRALIHKSDICLVSVLHFENENCLLLCLEGGKLIFSFYNESEPHIVYLSKKIVCIEKCFCIDSCLLWSDGIRLHHTKLSFGCGDVPVKLTHLKLNCNVACPLSILKIDQNLLTVTINRIYYCVSLGVGEAEEIRIQPQEVLSEIYKGAGLIGELQEKIDALSYYLRCKEFIQKNKAKVEIMTEGKRLLLKGCAGEFLRDFWKVKLTMTKMGKHVVQVVDLESDLKEGVLITIENVSKTKNKMKVSLIGDFNGNYLLVDLGEVGKTETDSGVVGLGKQLEEILAKRNPYVRRSLEEENIIKL